MPREIEDGDLQSQDIPSADADWPAIWLFVTTDGYAFEPKTSVILDARRVACADGIERSKDRAPSTF
jgi:hypothetical protein